jgi:hypothetical protein
MTEHQKESLNSFIQAFNVIKDNDSRLAESYASRYWDKYNHQWDIDLIVDRVVRNIQIDMLNIILNKEKPNDGI